MKRALLSLGLGLACVVAPACASRELPPKGQVVLYVDTDAMVREPTGTKPDPTLLSPMVDRARFEVLEGGKPLANNTRDVPIDAQMLRDRRLSFGVVPPPHATDITVRVRLFRADRVFGAAPEPGVTLDTTVTLPPVADEGIVEANVLLRTDDFGLVLGPIPAAPGAVARSVVSSWRGGKRAACTNAAAPGETCVPGASFFFGNPQFRGRVPTNDIFDERLAFVSPFFLDESEVTVASFRAVWPKLEGNVPEPLAQAPGNNEFCTWTTEPSAVTDARALNCVTWDTAEAYCEALGKTLPTEAEFELVTSGAGEEWAFPWGNDEPDCFDSVWGTGGIPTATVDAVKRGADDCRATRQTAGPLQPGQGQSDTIGTIQDLGGNVGEWMKDVWARPTDPFWASVRPIVDPTNVDPDPVDGPTIRPTRGGDWASTALTTRAGFRRQRDRTQTSSLIGFRCARPGSASVTH